MSWAVEKRKRTKELRLDVDVELGDRDATVVVSVPAEKIDRESRARHGTRTNDDQNHCENERRSETLRELSHVPGGISDSAIGLFNSFDLRQSKISL